MMSRPNILLITTDQQRFDTIAALGNPSIFTPHMDFMTQKGVTFTRAYSDCPICVPARNTLLTGRHGYTNNQTDMGPRETFPCNEHPTLPGLLTENGYQTRLVGKAHFSHYRWNCGFEHMVLTHDFFRYMKKHSWLGRPMDHGLGQNELSPGFATTDPSHTLTHWTVDQSIDFMETRDPSRPFFLWTSIAKPHPPMDPAKDFWDIYDGITMPEAWTGDWSADIEKMPQAMQESNYYLSNAHLYNRERLRNVRRAYYACISEVDYNLGRLYGRMLEMGLTENTWILLTSDHGEMLGDHRLGAKHNFLESSSHVPMLVIPPGPNWEDEYDERRGSRCDELVNHADIFTTLLHLSGTALPADTDGLDLFDIWQGKEARERLFGMSGEMHAVIEKQFKYHFMSAGGEELLFNLEEDPHEQKNLVTDPAFKDALERMRQLLIEHLQALDHPAARGGRLQSVREPKARAHAQSLVMPAILSGEQGSDVYH